MRRGIQRSKRIPIGRASRAAARANENNDRP
jgi:hypothetical protein